MTHELTKKIFRGSLPLALFAALLLAVPSANAQDNTQTRSGGAESASNRAPATASSGNVAPVVTPVFTNYRGVTIGMSADEARRTLDHIRDRGERLKTLHLFLKLKNNGINRPRFGIQSKRVVNLEMHETADVLLQLAWLMAWFDKLDSETHVVPL